MTAFLLPDLLEASWLKVLPAQRARARIDAQRPRLIGPHHRERRPVVYVDVSVIAARDSRTGIQRVVREILGNVGPQDSGDVRFIPLMATATKSYSVVQWNGLPVFAPHPVRPSPCDARLQLDRDDIFLALDFAPSILPRHWDQLVEWRRRGVLIHAVLYDMLPLHHPEWFTPRARVNFVRWLRTVCVFADTVHCISETTRRDLIGWMADTKSSALSPDALKSFPLGADFRTGCSTRAETTLGSRAALMVGTVEPRKGHSQVLDAFETLWLKGSDWRLVIVGRPGWQTDLLQQRLRQHAERGKRLLWIEDADDCRLTALYRAAAGVIVASRAEGMGLPLLEAAWFGKPVLARDLPVFRESAPALTTFFPDALLAPTSGQLQCWFESCIAEGITDCSSTPPSDLPTWQRSFRRLLDNMGLPVGEGTLRTDQANSAHRIL